MAHEFDFSNRNRKWTAKEKRTIIELRDNGISPQKISTQTNIPLGQVRFWIFGSSKKKRRGKSDYRFQHNDWLTWKSKALMTSFKSRGDAATFEIEDLKDWIVDVDKRCYYCTIELDQKNFGVDHAQPLSRAGQNTIENLRACCQKCNLIKGALTESEYKELRQLCEKWDDKGVSLFARLKRGNKFF
jgi:5-methylcytosine-specific restriction endonuclease McrA